MLTIFLAWLPLLLGLVLTLAKISRKRFIIPLILFVYFASLLLIIIFPIFQTLAIYGTGNPQLMAGAISEGLATGILRTIFDLPIIIIALYFIRRARRKKSFNPISEF